MSTASELAGKVVVLTGAARGIGAGTARVLAARGARLALIDRDPEVAAVAEALRDAGHETLALHADLGVEREVEAAFEQVKQQFGGIDVLIANHTVHACGPVLDT